MPALESYESIFERLQGNPHHILGLHSLESGRRVIRLWRPGAPYLQIEVLGQKVSAEKRGEEGLFECEVPENVGPLDYRIYNTHGQLVHDSYAFPPSIGEMDVYLFSKGVHYRLYDAMGMRLCTHEGIRGVKCAVWAPNARSVAIVGDFNLWDGRAHLMRRVGSSGIWELFIPELGEHEKYKLEVLSKEGHLNLKSDPFALWTEHRPSNASMTYDVNKFAFDDREWMENRSRRQSAQSPMNIYEVHLGSWKKKGWHSLGYRELAHELSAYCKEMGFSHVELMPIAEHPLDESWGYQVTGFFAVTSRHGSPEDFQYFVNHMHKEGLGVILDWVPAHFPVDVHSLAQFDGSYLFEHDDPRKGFHPHWNTYIFNYGRFEVSNFLIASALFWLDKMHVDGLRVDAVASMLYLDYGRKEGEWIPNAYGGNHNIEAIEFLKHLNAVVHEKFPGTLTFAEESTSFLGVTHPLERGGLGFDMKWNMGWMNDTLHYFHRPSLYRSHHQGELTFSMMYAYSEKYLLPFSHDEVVHGKASLLSKMPDDDWTKFANLRLLYSYQTCHPGKKLLFMGAEIGQWEEWSSQRALDWDLLHHDRHRMLQRFFKEMNHFYHAQRALWEYDFEERGFEWIDCSDKANSTLSYLRKGNDCYLLCVHNFKSHYFPDYYVPLSNVSSIREVFNSDREEYGGSGKINSHVSITSGVQIQLAPMATMIFEVRFV
ncbi:MAG: 1,4-alpha-glucan branching protein GlgB [Chlamydiota bacterium]